MSVNLMIFTTEYTDSSYFYVRSKYIVQCTYTAVQYSYTVYCKCPLLFLHTQMYLLLCRERKNNNVYKRGNTQMHGRAVRELLSDILNIYCSSVTARKLLIVPLYIYTYSLLKLQCPWYAMHIVLQIRGFVKQQQ